jgi:DNA-binding transcriptional LysR family regulator
VLITIGDLPNSNFGVQTIARSRFVLVATPGYLQAKGAPRVPADLTNHAIIVSARRDNPSFVQWTLRRGTAAETVFAQARIVSREGVHMPNACLSGAGICRQVKYVADPFLAAGDLTQVLPEWSLESFPVQAVYPNRKEVPAKVSALIGFFRTMLKEKQWWMRGERSLFPTQSAMTRRSVRG